MYGVVGEWAGDIRIFNAHHDDYGEITTAALDVAKFPIHDVSIHMALQTWEIYEPWRTDNATIGLRYLVEGGNLQDFGSHPAGWQTWWHGTATTDFQVMGHLSGNGGYMKGTYFMQFWGDPSEYEGGKRMDMATIESLRVVYDTSDGSIRHIHRTIDFGGPGSDQELSPDRPLETARDLGHEGDVAVVEVAAGDLVAAAQRVDLETQKLVTIARGR